MTAFLQRFKSWLGAPIDGRVLGVFRLVFGLFMTYYALYYYRIGLIPEGLLKTNIRFRYEFFEWVPLLPGPLMYAVLFLMGAAAALIAAGLFFRWACWVFSLCLAFFLFQEKSYYNNHIYLFILLPLLLSATDADRYFSLSKKSRPAAVQRWQQFILAAQITIVYFYAGIVKFKPDWLLRKEPMRSMILEFPDSHWMAPLIKHDFNIGLFAYGGFLLDILAPFLLFYKPVRNWVWIPFALFHLTNSQVFNDIGIFPFVMLGALILFFDTNEIPVLRSLARPAAGGGKGKTRPAPAPEAPPAPSALTRNLLLGYFAFQLLFPFRGFLLPNPLDYTTIGNRFAWRVKADTRNQQEVKFTIGNPATGEAQEVDITTFLNPMQIRSVATDPRCTVAFAKLLRDEAEKRGLPNAQVKASIRYSYNSRPVQDFIDPETDLASAACSPFRKIEWLVLPE